VWISVALLGTKTMPENARPDDAAIGLRVKSGWATAVLVGGAIPAPQVFDRRTIDLCDPAIPESRQPYHAGMGKLETNEAKVATLRNVILQATNGSVRELVGDYRKSGYHLRAVGLVVGSLINPARVTNPHIRAHALEGRLFRTVLEEAMQSQGLSCSVIMERNIYTRAAEVLQRSADDLRRCVTALGRSLGQPWRADEKVAALAAWLALA
jgi:hypothetical protein